MHYDPNHEASKQTEVITANEQADRSIVLTRAIELCRDVFADFDRYWIVGHKGDHPNTLRELGVFDGQGPHISVAHVHSTLGVQADHVVRPPKESSVNYEGVLGVASQELARHIGRVALSGEKVCVFMPFPNTDMSAMLAQQKADRHFSLTAPVSDPGAFRQIESKLCFAELMDRALRDTQSSVIRPGINTIPWTALAPGMMFSDLAENFELDEGQAVYVQKDFSAGGDGTRRISSQEELVALLEDPEWRRLQESDHVKATAEILHAYPANGSACIIPTGNGDCIVVVDPLSHKPVGLDEMAAKEGSGVGNDWSQPWPDTVNQQYIELATALGRRLYQEYGYTGQFGPDCLVQTMPGEPPTCVVRVNEVNPRWQGTTPYQTYNAVRAGRIPLELMHYIVKLDSEGTRIDELLALINDPDEYNARSVGSAGCFYMKVGGPKSPKEVVRDINGHYIYAAGHLFGPLEDITGVGVATGSVDHEGVAQLMQELREQGAQPTLITIKAPAQGEIVGGELAPVGYIVGTSDRPVFMTDEPGVTEHGRLMFQTVLAAMFGEQHGNHNN